MIQFDFVDDATTIEWTRVNKKSAKKAWNNGSRLIIWKHGFLPNNPDECSWTKDELDGADFDSVTDYIKTLLRMSDSAYLDFYVPSIKIPKYYNTAEYSLNNDGTEVMGIMFYLCDKPDKTFIQTMSRYNTNIDFPKAKSQFAPEQIKPLMFVPKGAYIEYM